jgi:hAT family C-terminal dimerisation region
LLRQEKKLDDAAIRAIIMDSRSFGDFRRAGMQSFLKIATPGYKGPAARTVQRNLKNLYDEKKKALKEQLKKIQYVSITADTWRSGRKRHYLCVTAYFVSSSYEQHGTILSFRQFYGRSFAKRLRRHIRTVLGMYGLEHGKVYVTTTDNGSDMRKATQYMDIFGIRLHCVAHGLNLVVQKSLNLWPRTNSMASGTSHTSSTTNKDPNEDEHTSSDESSDGESTIDRQSNHGSSGQDSADEETDGVGDLDSADDCSDSDNENTVVLDVQDVGILMVKCRKLMNTIRKSSILSDASLNLARDSVSVELVPDMKIRWNSTYRMIQRLLLHQNILGVFYDSLDTIDGVTAKQRKKLIEAKLTSLDWNILLAIRRVLERFNDATEILSGKSYPTLSLAYPVIYSLKNYLNDRAGDAIENAVKEIMLEKFNDYILPVPDSKHADILVSAAFLDPLVHDMLPPEHKLRAEKVLLNEVKKYQKMTLNNQNASPSVPVSSATSQSGSSKSSTMLKKFLTKCGVASTTDSTDQCRTLTIQQEIARMASLPKDNQDFSVFWQTHENTMPLLATQARKYLAVSATSVPSESAFSISNYILRKNRLSLTSKNLKYCMFLKDKLDC